MKWLVALSLLISPALYSMSGSEFASWWKNYREEVEIPLDLQVMEDYYVSSSLHEQSSLFWNYVNKYNIQQIVDYGYENFKQTVARNYFTWVVSLDHLYASHLTQQVPHLSIRLTRSEMEKVHPLFTPEESAEYNRITEYFINYIEAIGAAPLMHQLEEPLIGNPPSLLYKGKRVSQDICNSLLEFLPISNHCPLENISTILEIGAGSGRTAFCFLSLLPHIKYVIADVPPALFLSQTYLSQVFPDKNVMKFRPFEAFEEIAEEYAAADLVFITPDQLAKLPDQSADLFLAIDCLHEMKADTVASYFREADRLASYFYYKCWEETTIPFDLVKHTEKSYPNFSHWKELFREPCIAPSTFFHVIYKTSPICAPISS
ncbi:MAG: putative sugar O-methyltransferase [Verrucomicrobia bacterium]|nr:putative sugar O-methyltransferase [Verrucomicrobiota bacterium]